MKNLHLLPTDKPSRLVRNNKNLLKLCIQTLPLDRELNCFPQNIYITSDEEIKEWDYGILGKEVLSYNQMHKKWGMPQGEKIILTTDPDLIKDGVQAIDDEFLEWFVKNPSCEEVKIEKVLVTNSGLGHQEYAVLDSSFKVIEINAKIPQTSYSLGKVTILDSYEYVVDYKIIIPKEEPKQELKIGDNTNFGIITDIKEYSVCFGKNKVGVDIWYKKSDVKLVPNQETLEEAALAIIPDKSTPGWIDTHSAIERRGFIKGAKWQAEQEYAEYLADETKKWNNAQSELEAYRQHRRSSEYQEKKLKFKQELNDAMHEAHQTGRVINQEQSAFVKKDDVDGEWLSPVATERAWQEEQLVNIFGHYPNASPRWQYMNGLIQNSLQAERMYSEEEVLEMFHKFNMHLPLHYEFLVKEQFKKK